ncbi:hypothetical protein Tco_0705644 [Tanacetum coccineum]|uniref:Uncharacterized protein n=1 Tax=Tanacetum coccineum TaxID=301880 RepID=A0ABQ4Y6Q3_9ASTR
MTVSGFGKDEILRTLTWRPIAVAAMASFENRNGKGCNYECQYEQPVHRLIWRKACEFGAKPVGVFVDEDADRTPRSSDDANLQFVQVDTLSINIFGQSTVVEWGNETIPL